MSTVRRARPPGVDHRVLHRVPASEGVGHRVQFAGARVPVWMGGVAPGQGAVEIACPNGVQLVGEFVGGDACFDEGQGLAGVGQHAGVGAQGQHAGPRVDPGGRRLAEGGTYRRAAHPSVAVPAGLSAAQRDPVDHAVAAEPVVDRGVDLCHRVGPVAQVTPVEVVGDVAGDRQVGRGHLGAHRRQEAVQIGVQGGGGVRGGHVQAPITLLFLCYRHRTPQMRTWQG